MGNGWKVIIIYTQECALLVALKTPFDKRACIVFKFKSCRDSCCLCCYLANLWSSSFCSRASLCAALLFCGAMLFSGTHVKADQYDGEFSAMPGTKVNFSVLGYGDIKVDISDVPYNRMTYEVIILPYLPITKVM